MPRTTTTQTQAENLLAGLTTQWNTKGYKRIPRPKKGLNHEVKFERQQLDRRVRKRLIQKALPAIIKACKKGKGQVALKGPEVVVYEMHPLLQQAGLDVTVFRPSYEVSIWSAQALDVPRPSDYLVVSLH